MKCNPANAINKQDFANVPVTWEPKEDSGINLKLFIEKVKNKYKVEIENYWDLHRWSIENLEAFWTEIWERSGIIFSKKYTEVIDLKIPMYELQNWFVGARLNYAENILKYRDDKVALIVTGEDKETEKVTYAEMFEEVKLYTAALKKHGVKKGDKIACFMSNRKEAIFAMLASTSFGAIWLGALPLMGSQAVLNRFIQVEPKILFTVDQFLHNRKEYNNIEKLKVISANVSSLEKVVIVASKKKSKSNDISGIRNSCFLEEFLESGKNSDGSIPEIVFEQLPFSYPTFINYTSGTTGLPKALIHSGANLLTTHRDFQIVTSLGSNRSSCWLLTSPVGWITWNLGVTMLCMGISIVVFEGVPYYLTPTFFWDMVDEFGITKCMLTPSVLDEMERKGCLPTVKHHLRSLKMVIGGGSSVKKQNVEFFHSKIKKDAAFMNGYGSTEACGACIMMMAEILNIHSGEIPASTLGMDVLCLDEFGKEISGDVGELVINKTFPNMPLGIYGDCDRSIYKKTYFHTYPGKFTSGDLCIINPFTKGFLIYGRSDCTLKPRGCRFGSSEIYNVVDGFLEVEGSLCVSHYNSKRDERAVLFLKMRNGCCFDQNLVRRIGDAVSKELSPRHVPEVILETKAIPFNMNTKKMEIIVKKIINKMPYNPETVVNPQSLENFKNVPELGEFV